MCGNSAEKGTRSPKAHLLPSAYALSINDLKMTDSTHAVRFWYLTFQKRTVGNGLLHRHRLAGFRYRKSIAFQYS
jgi:hypothetical protein